MADINNKNNSPINGLIINGFRNNKNFNTNTQAGENQPNVLVNAYTNKEETSLIDEMVESRDRLRYTNRDIGLDMDRIKRDEEMGIMPNPYNTNEELNIARAEAQSNWAKFGNFLMQAGIGEVVLGTLEGFGNIVDGIANTFTGDNYGVNPYTKYMHDLKEDFTKEFEIYQRDPNGHWNMNDFGWWMQNMVSVATTASLMLPAAGWAKGLSMAGKVSGASKLLRAGNKYISRGLANIGRTNKAANRYSAFRSIASASNKIENTITYGSGIIGQAALSRAGENYMEANAIFNDVYASSLENLTNMIEEDARNGTNEFEKFLRNNPEFRNKDGMPLPLEDIAREIAKQSANKTFYNDWWMIGMDALQFKALGKLWGHGGRRASTARERIAAQNVKRTLAGEPTENLIKDNLINRTKEKFKYAIKHPLTSVQALEIGEGFEEMYQGIQSEKGYEVATKYFDPTMTPRTLGSYLTDNGIWEQFAWGAVGGIAFNAIGKGIQSVSNKIEANRKKKSMTADEYEMWKKSDTEISIAQLNEINETSQTFINDMEKIENGINPYDFIKDPETGQIIIREGELINETIDEVQKDLLRQEAIDRFIVKTTMLGIDRGNYGLIKEILSSKEFDKFIDKNSNKLKVPTDALTNQIVSRMEEVENIYSNSLRDVNNVSTSTNPFVTINAARTITRMKLGVQELDNQLANIAARISEVNDTGLSYNNYFELIRYNNAKKQLANLQNEINAIQKQYDNGEMANNVYQRKINEINKIRKEWINYLANTSTKGSIESIKQSIKDSNKSTEEIISEFETFSKEYEKEFSDLLDNDTNVPSETIRDLMEQAVTVESRRNYTNAQIPINQKEFEDIYNEFGMAMDLVTRKKVDDYIDEIKKYLRNIDDFDKAVENLLVNKTGNKKIDEAINFLNYGYINPNLGHDIATDEMLRTAQLSAAIEEIRKERNKDNQRVQEAAEEGVDIPETVVPSTGESTESVTTDTTSTTSTTDTTDTAKPKQTETITVDELRKAGVQSSPDKEIIIDNDIPVETEYTEEKMTSTELEEASKIASGYETEEVKATLDASKYVMQIGYTKAEKLDEITESLNKEDNSKYDELIKEITDFLINKGYNKNIAEVSAKRGFTNTIASFGALNKKSAFGRLAYQLANGISKKTSEKYSITEILDGAGIDEIIDEFLEEYSKLVKGSKFGEKYIINLQSLFDYILNEENINKQTAAYIYNNIGKYIAKNDESKYIFTGYNTRGTMMSSEMFFNRLNENKSQIISSADKLHIGTIEPENRSKNYTEALIAAANGAKTYIQEERNKEGVVTSLGVYVNLKKGKKVTSVKVGVLRTVNVNNDLSKIDPVSHNTGFGNRITIKDKNIHLDCDELFNSIIEGDTLDSQTLFNDIVNYYIQLRKLTNDLNNKRINEDEFNKASKKLIDKNFANAILNNPIIKKAIENRVYIFDTKIHYDEVKKARKIIDAISSILFYGNYNGYVDMNNSIDTLAVDKVTMQERYNRWKNIVYNNYTYTYELQKSFNEDNNTVNIDLNVGFYTELNDIKNKEDYVNIDDAGFNIDRNSNNPDIPYTPFVMVNKDHILIDEYGNEYGYADLEISNYSAGFIVHNENGIKLTSYCSVAQELKDAEITKHIRKEIANLINMQLNNTNKDNHDEIFYLIRDRLEELFSKGGLFRFDNIKVSIAKDNSWVNIQEIRKTKEGTKYVNLISVYLKNSKSSDNSSAIKIFNPKANKYETIYSSNDKNYTVSQINSLINDNLDIILRSVKLNKSLKIMENTKESTDKRKIVRRENGKFIINLAGEDIVYDSYGDFMLKNRGFNININRHNGGFVKRYINEDRLSINATIKDNSDNVVYNTNVTDLLYKDNKAKRKTVDTSDLLEAAGVSQDKIDVLLGTNSGMPIVTKRINVLEDIDDKANMFYDVNDKNIYITPKGATSMNNNPTNAIRLVLHENLHRLFNNKSTYNNTEKERILNETREVYDYTINKLKEDVASGRIKQETYNAIIDVFNKATSYENEQTNMEEFLVECLTQPLIINYLNNADYHSEVNIDGITQKTKTIFQKIMDILLNLFGINSNRIKNNSILAKEYLILSKGNTNTSNITTDAIAETNNAKSPVEGKATTSTSTSSNLTDIKTKIDNIRSDFESRIKRSDNFAEDHTYYLDGKPVDYSVTQKIHGKQDLGDWGIPSSLLGNSADEAARLFFDNGDKIPTTTKIPNFDAPILDENETIFDNSITGFEHDLKRLREYLDNRFGKGKYGVITQEFPIGAIINVNGEDKTIAGTMDMIVYTDAGEIYIFDFKTKHVKNDSGNIDEKALIGYSQQVNIYRQILENNYPELKGKVKIGGLIKFNVEYPRPSNNIKYRENPDVSGQLQVDEGYGFNDIQNSGVDYYSPYFWNREDMNGNIIEVEIKDYTDEIKALPKIEIKEDKETNTKDLKGSELIQDNIELENLNFDDIGTDEYGIDEDEDVFFAKTDLIEEENKNIINKTSAEIYAPAIANGSNLNTYGVKVVNTIDDFVNTFPMQYRDNIKQILADSELNYTCQ